MKRFGIWKLLYLTPELGICYGNGGEETIGQIQCRIPWEVDVEGEQLKGWENICKVFSLPAEPGRGEWNEFREEDSTLITMRGRNWVRSEIGIRERFISSSLNLCLRSMGQEWVATSNDICSGYDAKQAWGGITWDGISNALVGTSSMESTVQCGVKENRAKIKLQRNCFNTLWECRMDIL